MILITWRETQSPHTDYREELDVWEFDKSLRLNMIPYLLTDSPAFAEFDGGEAFGNSICVVNFAVIRIYYRIPRSVWIRFGRGSDFPPWGVCGT